MCRFLNPLLFVALSSVFFCAQAATSYTYRIPVENLSINNCQPGSQTFTYTGAPQTFAAPAGCTKLSIMAWGGGGGISSGNNSGFGVSFAYVQLSYSSALQLTIEVGQGGSHPSKGAV